MQYVASSLDFYRLFASVWNKSPQYVASSPVFNVEMKANNMYCYYYYFYHGY